MDKIGKAPTRKIKNLSEASHNFMTKKISEIKLKKNVFEY